MDENPYQSPSTDTRVVGVLSGRREDLRSVALYQKGVLVCILIYLIAVFLRFALPPELHLFVGLGVLVLGLVGAVFTVLLAMRVYGTALGIVLGILVFIPCIGLLVLLMVDSKATRVLKQNGIKVGLLGADLSKV